jgi:hypothetical protein
MPDQDTQADIVVFGARGFLDRAVAHFDRLRDCAHGQCIGGISPGAPGGRDQPIGKCLQWRLIEER